MKQEDDELWAYDEPHESGGNLHITMTRRQAINHMRKRVNGGWDLLYPKDATDSEVFYDWVVLHWAYREEKKDAK